MPYFSFSLNQKFLDKVKSEEIKNFYIKPNISYFSKNTKLWKILNKNFKYNDDGYVKYEQRKKITNINDKILFFLPPSIGLGDSIEYALAIKSILKSNKFSKVGVAFVGRYKNIFTNLFKIKNVFKEIISIKDFENFNTIFHISLEILPLKNQKYLRSDIETNITKYFGTKKIRNHKIKKLSKIDTITIFPISNSPIRTMPLEIIQSLIDKLQDKYKIEFILDKESSISNLIEKKIDFKKVKKLYPQNIETLINLISMCKFGIFMDSGPLHVAKIFSKPGILIETSVKGNLLLSEFDTIKILPNFFKSDYCEGPCGLTNIFNYKNNAGCYQSLKVDNNILKNLKKNALQRGTLKNKYSNFIFNPVGCVKNINLENLIYYINKHI